MTDNLSIFESEYIIDGKRCELTPGQMLRECMPYPYRTDGGRQPVGSIVDESVDRVPTSFIYDVRDIDRYKEMTIKASSCERNFMMQYPETFTAQRIAGALIDAIWKKGHFKLENIILDAEWNWKCEPIGNMSAFYSSTKAAAEYIYDLGVSLETYSCKMTEGACNAKFKTGRIADSDEEDDIEPYISEDRICPDALVPDKTGWLIYVPFDSCPFKLGGSLLAECAGQNGGAAPEIKDPDYFIDCYEVIRELAEDGVITAGTTVGDGGLLTAAEKMCQGTGISLNISGIKSAYGDNDIVRILFSEVPGVLIQIEDCDYDYIDAQMLLQDIAYYPLGHPSKGLDGASVMHGGKPGVADILAALIQGASEGED